MPADQRLIDQSLETLLKAPRKQVDLSELAEALITEFGGPVSFAKTVRQQFDSAAPGGMQRSQIMKTVLGVVEKHASLTKADSRPEERMSDEELRYTAMELLGEISSPDAEVDPPASEPGEPEPKFG
jgi:hypothetical protein